MYCETASMKEPFTVDADVSFLEQKLRIQVAGSRLHREKGDIALALDPECCRTEYCARPVVISGEAFAITGALHVRHQARYECLRAYHLMHITLYPWFLKTYADILREFPRQDTRCYTGLVVRMPDNDLYVMAEQADILAVDSLI